jgi:hypothetical protein
MEELIRIRDSMGYVSMKTSSRAVDILKLLVNLLEC